MRSAADIFNLLDQIDQSSHDILFLADEGGSWEVGVDWENVLPAWFKVLSATAGHTAVMFIDVTADLVIKIKAQAWAVVKEKS